MYNKINENLQKITWQFWLVMLILSQVFYFIMLSQTLPQIQQEANGMKVFDLLQFGYSTEYVYKFLSQLSSKGYELYQFIQLPLDTFYPILNCLTGISTFILLLRLYRKINEKNVQQNYSLFAIILLLLPVTAMITDYLENIMIVIMLSSKTVIPDGIVMASSSFTIIKSMSVMLFYSICLMMLVIIGITSIIKKVKRIKPIG